MCPPYSIPRRILPPARVSTPWLEAARCVKTIFARCRRTFRPVCRNCVNRKSPNERESYDTIARHCMFVGDSSEIDEICFDCRSRTVSPRPCSSCPVCTRIIEDFGNYPGHSGDTPHSRPNITIIAIRQLTIPGLVDPLVPSAQ